MQLTHPQDDMKIHRVYFYEVNQSNDIGQLLNTLLATAESPTGVVTEIGSIIILGKTLNYLATKGVTNDKVSRGSSKAYI